MTPTPVKGKRVTVMGLGRFGGGTSVARWLAEQGARVTATDQQTAEQLGDVLCDLAGLDINFKLGGHDEVDFTGADLIVANPAVPPADGYLQSAQRAGVPITTEIVLLIERLPMKLVFGVTGTKGKSTTAALLAKMLGAWRPLEREQAEHVRGLRSRHVDLTWDSEQGRKVWLGGNIGGSLLSKLPEMGEHDFVVLELSSYMLHYLGLRKWSPHVAVVTMVQADHATWHGGVDAYHQAKQNIVRHQSNDDFAVVPTFSKLGRAFGDSSTGTVIEYGKRANLPERFAPRLPGKHNRLNERGAFAAARLVGVYPDQAVEAVADFAGLPHRLQHVHEDENGVKWVNDSIATIPEAAAAACEAFEAGRVIQIVGGSDKGLPLEAMARTLAQRCKAVLCIGQMGPAVARLVGAKAIECHDLAAAVAKARQIALAGDVVLLSPGFASYDQFSNFEERGQAFARLCRA